MKKYYNGYLKIKNLKRYKDSDCVSFTVESDDGYGGDVKELNYCTDNTGSGLWIEDPQNGMLRQVEGYCQFSLHQKTIEGIRKALYRYFVG